MAQNEIIITDSFNKNDLRNSIYLFTEKDPSNSIDDLIDADSLFERIDYEELNFGFSDNIIWIKIIMTNQSQENWYITLPRPNIRLLDFYKVDTAIVSKSETGFYRPFENREILTPNYSFRIAADSRTYSYFFRIENYKTDLPFQIDSETVFFNQIFYNQLSLGIFYGLLLIMIGYNLVLSITLKDVAYLNYTVFLTFLCIGLSGIDHILQQYIITDSPVLSTNVFRMSMMATCFFAIRYTNYILELRTDKKFLYKIAQVYISIVALQFIVAPFYYNYIFDDMVILFAAFFMFYSGVAQVINRYRPAYIYFAGVIFLLVSVLIFMLPILGADLSLVRIGVAIMVTLFSIALSDRIRLLRDEKMDIQTKLATEKDRLIQIKNELNQSLKDSMSELEQKNSELEQYSYTVSHDLKNPLITIQGYLGQLRQDAKKADLKAIERDITYINDATFTMNQLLEDLLNFSRIGYKSNKAELVDLQELIEKTIQMNKSLINQKYIEIRLQDSYPNIYGDRIRLFEVFQNLIVNAIKYSRPNKKNLIEIMATVHDDFVQCAISDQGLGIEEQYQDRIFTLFEQLDPNGEGTGIGLSIVKRIIELHGGKIWVESEGKNKGATFIFELPMVNGDIS